MEIATQACRLPQNLKYCSVRLRAHRPLVEAAVRASSITPVLGTASEDLKQDEELVIAQLKTAPQYMADMRKAKSPLASSKKFILRALVDATACVSHLSEAMKDDIDVMRTACSHGGLNIEQASMRLKANKDVVLHAMRYPNAGIGLTYADRSLRDDKDVALAAVRSSPQAVLYLSEKMRADRDIAAATLERHGDLLHYFPASIKSDAEQVERAIRCNPRAYRSADPRLQADKGLALLAVAKCGSMLRLAPPPLHNDKDIVIAAVANDVKAYEEASEALRADMDVALALVRHKGGALTMLPKELRSSRILVREAFLQARNWFMFPHEVSHDKAFLEELKAEAARIDQAKEEKELEAAREKEREKERAKAKEKEMQSS
eukprot:TRINITY_DN62973_c0_g1_i1.p1 TRINITY_DN62973_c0_g1~~TRINITY_DN62973_c0_g1_i1.p1  ORF type:complete len:392 (+),score=137.41 TRINITY_DN62973_c0_g1_i1:47-1177(+)